MRSSVGVLLCMDGGLCKDVLGLIIVSKCAVLTIETVIGEKCILLCCVLFLFKVSRSVFVVLLLDWIFLLVGKTCLILRVVLSLSSRLFFKM